MRAECRCFNEARAGSPGKFPGARAHTRYAPSCFNEARAGSPGKFVNGEAEYDVTSHASMRPGPDRPGNQIGQVTFPGLSVRLQ